MADRRLTVVQLLPALDGGGVEQGTIEIAQALTGAGHRSLVVSAGGRMLGALEATGTQHFAWPVGAKRPATLALAWRLRRLLRDEAVDIVHARSRVPAWIAWIALRGMARAGRPRFVTTVHGLYSVSRYSAVMTRGERVIVVSEAVRRYVLDNYPEVEPARLSLVHRGIDPCRYPYGYQPPAAWRAAWRSPAPDGVPLLLLPGRLTRLKGHEVFLRLLARLRASGIAAHGLVAGGEDPRRLAYARRLYASAAELPITFLGHRSDLRELMAQSTLVLSLSAKPESFGRTVLEALSLGRPVAGFGHGGVGEILDALYPCGAVPAGDENRLFEQVAALLRDAPSVARAQPFTLADMQRRTLALYADVAGAARS